MYSSTLLGLIKPNCPIKTLESVISNRISTFALFTANGLSEVALKSVMKIHRGSYMLLDLILYIPSTIFQLCREGSSWVEPELS